MLTNKIASINTHNNVIGHLLQSIYDVIYRFYDRTRTFDRGYVRLFEG